jgi:hypothetical protein
MCLNRYDRFPRLPTIHAMGSTPTPGLDATYVGFPVAFWRGPGSPVLDPALEPAAALPATGLGHARRALRCP